MLPAPKNSNDVSISKAIRSNNEVDFVFNRNDSDEEPLNDIDHQN